GSAPPGRAGIPRASVVEEARQADAQRIPQILEHGPAVFDQEVHQTVAGERVSVERPRALAEAEVELVARDRVLLPAELAQHAERVKPGHPPQPASRDDDRSRVESCRRHPAGGARADGDEPARRPYPGAHVALES